MAKSIRLQSLDVLRGLTVAGMILVNNGYSGSFEMLRHAEWNGLSVSDFVFPFFLFIMGVSIYLSFSKGKFGLTPLVFGKILKRTIILLALGILINWVELGLHSGWFNFQDLRFWAVLQRIALCYFVAAFMAVTCSHRIILPVAFALLIIYGFIITAGNGYSSDKALNILYITDFNIFGDSHLYHKSPVDPEGLVSTISSLTNVLFGFYCGMALKRNGNLQAKTISCFVFGSLLLILGFFVSFFLPVNKHIWSPSFALITSGACAVCLGLFVKWIDTDKMSGSWTSFFKVFGANALLLYITSEFMAIFFGFWGISDLLFAFWASLFPYLPLASLGYALTYVCLNFLIGYPLWRKHIYIKL